MSDALVADSALALVEVLKRKAPAYLDLVTATTDTEFEAAFDALLAKALMHLEASKKQFIPLSEDGLSSALAGTLSMPGLVVMRETNSNGHVDLTIIADHCQPPRKKLGEAKVWNGADYHIKGVDQLLTRYTTGREGRGLLIAYVRQKNINGLIAKLRKKMDAKRPCNQKSATGSHALRWSFISAHAHSSGEAMEVAHVGCNLFVDTTAEGVG